MKRQRNATQMKEQIRNTEVQINEEEIGKLHENEFRIMIVKMIKNLENKMCILSSFLQWSPKSGVTLCRGLGCLS